MFLDILHTISHVVVNSIFVFYPSYHSIEDKQHPVAKNIGFECDLGQVT